MHDMGYLGLSYIGVFVGAGLCLIGGAYGISKLASAAFEGERGEQDADERQQAEAFDHGGRDDHHRLERAGRLRLASGAL